MDFLTKYIIITGGVVSSIGKGITSASIGRILRSYGLKVSAIKIDPYLNWDSGTLNPYQHGEVYVTHDGMETDLDLGHYERFLDVELDGLANITTGKVYESVIAKEREGGYLGECVQVIPHITNRIKEMIRETSESTDYDVVLIELGGTVGDIESQPFLEALRQLRNEEGRENVMFVHVTFIPYLNAAGEFKTKPTQHSTKELRSVGINPDVIVCRSQEHIDEALLAKVAHFCDVDVNAVVNTPDAGTIYEVPLVLEDNNIGELIVKRIGLNIDSDSSRLDGWRKIVDSLRIKNPEVTVGIVGKYVELEDAYISIRESLLHAAASIGVKANIKYLSSDVDELDTEVMKEFDGILIPGGFGERGFEGKLDAVDYAIRIANKNNKCPCDIPVYITKNGKKYQVKDYNFGIAFGHEINVFIDFNEYNVIEYVAPDSRPEEGEYWRSRGTGVGSDGVADCSGFVVSKLAGERLRRMVRLVLESDDTKSYLDFREREPNWIQFKFNGEEFDVEKLDKMAHENNDVLTIDILKQCKIQKN